MSPMVNFTPCSYIALRPNERLLETNGLSALVEFISEEAFKASAYMTDTLIDPAPGPPSTAHMRAFHTSENMFQWFENPANKARLTRFGIAMQGSAAEEPEDTIFKGFKWESLPAGSVIVDVGGGLGASSLSIARRYPRAENRQPGSGAGYRAVEGARQRRRGFLVRYVVHDWSDTNLGIILTHPRAVARPETKLVIIENIAASACSSESTHPHASTIPILGVPRKPAAPPVLANYGMAGLPLYYYDLTVNNLLGGTECTLEGFYDVLLQAGWRLVEVYHCPQTDSSYVIAEPVV
ncbi:hypothetical protein B0H14DRAFT_3128139 [Mycena olivaceomarginata]|nr:hypothetical protein B0H14DRAFT_3128139 [Mycena olivaceomarginata]